MAVVEAKAALIHREDLSAQASKLAQEARYGKRGIRDAPTFREALKGRLIVLED